MTFTQMSLLLCALSISACISACISVDKKPPESPLSTLNGEKYVAAVPAVSVGGIPLSGPFVKRRNAATFIVGKIVENRSQGLYKRPVKFQTVFLKRADTEVKAATNEYGEFRISEDLAEGAWELCIKDCLEPPRKVEVKGFEIDLGEWTVVCKK